MKKLLLLLAILVVSCGPQDIRIDVFCHGNGDKHSGFLDCLWGAEDAGTAGSGGTLGAGGTSAGGATDASVSAGGATGGASSGGTTSGGSPGSGGSVDAGSGGASSGGTSAGGAAGAASGGAAGSGAGGAPPLPCANGIRDGAETATDCGGGVCPGCGVGLACSVGTDCASGYCSAALTCQTPTCTDGVQNGTETGLDCGGSCSPCPTQLQLAQMHLQHLVFLVMENRTFDHYFGTYPGADGLPRDASGNFTSCNPDPNNGGRCVYPFHNTADANVGGPHSLVASTDCIDNGAMDHFVKQAEISQHGCADPNDPNCSNGTLVDVMGFHDRGEVPKYWNYADNFVLQDHLYEPDLGYSLSSHLAMVSGWSAKCTSPTDPTTCIPKLDQASTEINFAWTDITQLMWEQNVSWRYYLGQGQTPSCSNADAECPPCSSSILPQNCNGTNTISAGDSVPQIWNPLPHFATVTANGQSANVTNFQSYYAATPHAGGGCALPAVSWIAPSNSVSEHPSAKVSVGQRFVVGLMNRLMHSDCWASTAVFIFWDDYGGFFDHVRPPVVDSMGYGIRVPGLMVSPWAKTGYIDHQTLSFDAYLKLIEDVFLGGSRLNPATMARPDPRPSVRENASILGDLLSEFDFNSPPRPALVQTQTFP